MTFFQDSTLSILRCTLSPSHGMLLDALPFRGGRELLQVKRWWFLPEEEKSLGSSGMLTLTVVLYLSCIVESESLGWDSGATCLLNPPGDFNVQRKLRIFVLGQWISFQHPSESSGKHVKVTECWAPSLAFWFTRSRVGPKNLHF